jgi:hypothetical protein
MRVQELFENQEDLPIIFDIIQKKLAARVPILLDYSSDELRYSVTKIRFEPASDLEEGGSVRLYWLCVSADGAYDDTVCVRPSNLNQWRLKQVGTHLELSTMGPSS